MLTRIKHFWIKLKAWWQEDWKSEQLEAYNAGEFHYVTPEKADLEE